MDLISFLGTGDYVAVSYTLGSSTTREHAYVPVALTELLGNVERVVVFATEKADEKHGKALREQFEARGIQVDVRSIPDGHTVEELWRVFAEVEEVLDSCKGAVALDVTHGFRSLQMVSVVALAFWKVLNSRDVRLYYGAFEALGAPPNEIRRRQEAGEEVAPAPVFDLSPMLDVLAWAETTAEWTRTGRALGLLERAIPALRALRRELAQSGDRQQAGVVQRLGDGLSILESSLSMLKHDQIGEAARRVVDSIADTRTVIDARRRELRPFTAVLGHVAQKLELLHRNAGGDWQVCDERYIAHQLDIAEWLLELDRLVEGCSILREALTSCIVRFALTAGIKEIPGTKDGKPVAYGPCHEKYRETVDGLLGCILRGEKQKNDDEVERTLRATLQSALDRSHEIKRQFEVTYEGLRQLRNKLDHCWTGQEHSGERLDNTSEPAGDLRRRIQEAKDYLRDAHVLASLLAASGGEVEERLRTFVNLTNHPIETWPTAQLEAARALDLGEPTDLPDGLPLVPPEATDEEVARMAREIAERAVALGAAGAAVQGEPTFTLALVRELQARGVPCFAATTHREVESTTHGDGHVERTSRYRFVRWRQYPVTGLVHA